MKKLLLSPVLFLLSAVLIAGNLKAQKNLAGASVTNSEATSANPSTEISKAAPKDINVRSINDFNRNYKNAANVQWHKTGEVTTASFNENGRITRVMYLPDGRWLHTMISYDKSQLPDDVKSQVERSFRKYTIHSVTEIHERDMVFYHINIENDKYFKNLIAYQDAVWVHNQFRKQ